MSGDYELATLPRAFRSILCRTAKPEEMQLLLKYYDEEKMEFTKASSKAKKLIAAGEYPHPEIKDITSLAALMQVVHTIYNMEESITKT